MNWQQRQLAREAVPGRGTYESLGLRVMELIPQDVALAVLKRQVTLNQGQLLAQAGLEIPGHRVQSLQELLGPTTLAAIDRNYQAFYFSGPNHPVLAAARRSDHHITRSDFLEAGQVMGVQTNAVNGQYKVLAGGVFTHPETVTYGSPEPFNYIWPSKETDGYTTLDRFSVRASTARSILDKELVVEVVDRDTLYRLTGTGRSILRHILEPLDEEPRRNFIMAFEELDNPLLDTDCANETVDHTNLRGWFENREGDRTALTGDERFRVYRYLHELAEDAGMLRPEELAYWYPEISNECVVLLADSLCDKGQDHTAAVRNGRSCEGLHIPGTTKNFVRKLKIIASCLSGQS